MKCDEIKLLREPHLDSELDARTAVEIEQHLKSCPGCATAFAEAARLDARIAAGLTRGGRTAGLWEQIERSVVATADSAAARSADSHVRELAGLANEHADMAVRAPVVAGGAGSSRAWGVLAATWVVIFALHFAARGTDSTILATQAMPTVAAVRSAWTQNQLLMAELADTFPPVAADRPKPVPPGPRGDRRNETPYA